jgi:hypothetical protein
LNAITELFTGVDQELLPFVFDYWVNRLKWVIKHERKYYRKSRKIRDTSSGLGEKMGGYKFMDPHIKSCREIFDAADPRESEEASR